MNINDNNTNLIDYIHEFIIIHENNWYNINMIDNIIHEFIIIDESIIENILKRHDNNNL
jgi:hypothetical protein